MQSKTGFGYKDANLFYIEEAEPEEAARTIFDLCKSRFPAHYHVDPTSIQLLTTKQKGAVGAFALNQLLQEELNPEQLCLYHGGIAYRLHDKVMPIRNNYDKKVFKDDISIVNKISMEDKNMTVDFDGWNVDYDITELDKLFLSYAVMVHKSQDSE